MANTIQSIARRKAKFNSDLEGLMDPQEGSKATGGQNGHGTGSGAGGHKKKRKHR